MLESMLLTSWLMSASMPEGCAVMATVFHSTEQTFALLHSDCLIEIQRHDRWIIMTSPRWSSQWRYRRHSGSASLPTPGARPGLCLEPDRRPASGSRWPWAIAQGCRARTEIALPTRITQDLEFAPMHKSIVYGGVTTSP